MVGNNSFSNHNRNKSQILQTKNIFPINFQFGRRLPRLAASLVNKKIRSSVVHANSCLTPTNQTTDLVAMNTTGMFVQIPLWHGRTKKSSSRVHKPTRNA